MTHTLSEESCESYDLSSSEDVIKLSECLESMTPEKAREMEVRILALIDDTLRSKGLFCGVPIVSPDSKGLRYIGYHLSGFHDAQEKKRSEEPNSQEILNRWFFRKGRRRGCVSVYQQDGSKTHAIDFVQSEDQDRFSVLLATFFSRKKANPVSAELKAQEKLKTLVEPQQWDDYVLSDMFVEVGRSGVLYLLRKGRPTVACRKNEYGLRFLASLCLHPLGYFEDTFAGAMTPTDELVAHLLFIRADEHQFWKQANHHGLDDHLNGL